tara:strand:+ start:19 stop:270 length:252 start_codon:yes stop_codon:yes gene_type:complete
MTILGGHRPHEKANQEKSTKKSTKNRHYSETNDIAVQLKSVKSLKNYCKIPEDYYSKHQSQNFMYRFMNKMSKWLNKKEVEID